jgi:hypothetical protein
MIDSQYLRSHSFQHTYNAQGVPPAHLGGSWFCDQCAAVMLISSTWSMQCVAFPRFRCHSKTLDVQKTVELNNDVTTLIIVRDITGRLMSSCS